MKNIFSLFSRAQSQPIHKDSGFRLQSQIYNPSYSNPKGEFTFYLGNKAQLAMKELIGLSVEEMQALPARVLSKCRELGFAHNEPSHFIFDAQEIAREPSWSVMKIFPPIRMQEGIEAACTINAFLPTIRRDIQNTKNETLAASTLMGVLGRRALQAQYASAAPSIIKAKYKMILSHEMVHVFATDEHREIMQVLGLDLLELLTDAINLVTFYPDYKKAGDMQKIGVMEGIGYISNLLLREQPGRPCGPEMLELAHERAKQIIRECRQKCEEARQAQPVSLGLTRATVTQASTTEIQSARNG